MKRTILNATGGILIAIAFLLILCESDFKTASEFVLFLLIKLIGFVIGYIGFNIIEVPQGN